LPEDPAATPYGKDKKLQLRADFNLHKVMAHFLTFKIALVFLQKRPLYRERLG
jgi:hypothetical protein